jgi:hypothetical protein
MEFDTTIQGRWIIALVCGAASAVFLFSWTMFLLLGPLSVVFALGLSLVGIAMGGLSFAAKEKKRLCAVPGVVLAAIAPTCFLWTLFL